MGLRAMVEGSMFDGGRGQGSVPEQCREVEKGDRRRGFAETE